MTYIKHVSYVLVLLVAMLFFAVASPAFADHEASVAGQVIFLAGASLGHGENCDDVHYHGDLNGIDDPDPEGCGHGIVTILPHDDNDESIVPETETEEEDDGPSVWSKIGNFFANIADVVVQALGGSSPKSISDSVDIVVEAAPSIKEKIDNIKAYRESAGDEDTLGIYDTSTDDLEEGSLSKRFFDWVNSIGN